MNYRIFIFGTIWVAFIMQACSDMNELSDRFLKEGEIIYAAMVDSASIGAGEKRVKIEMRIKSIRIQTVRIYWNDKTDSTDVNIDNKSGFFSRMIENLQERNYIFNLVSFDKYGNQSLSYELSGRALGELYRGAMINRVISKIETNAGKTVLTWGDFDVSSDARFNEIKYTSTANEETIREAPISEGKTEISDMKNGSIVEYRTAYVPDDMEVDIFYTDWVTYVVN